MIPARQLWLQLNTAQDFNLLQGQHHERVGLAHIDQAGKWHPHGGTCDHETASALVFNLASRRQWDCYISQAGFSSSRRVVADVSALTAAYVDLDTYKVPGLAGLSENELLDSILAQHPWLPVPTEVVASGRGHYLKWLFTKPLDREQLHRWQAVTDALIGLLRPFGADPACKDAARVLRIVGSVNQKSGREVVAYQTGHPVAFERFERLVLNHAAPVLSPPRKPRLEVVQRLEEDFDGNLSPVSEPRVSTATAGQRLKPYKLALDRMHDCSTLAGLRGSPKMQDYRHRLLFVFGVAGAWYWSGLAQAEQELEHFAGQHFAGADRYNSRRVQTVLDLMEKQLVGRVARIENGERVDWRYKQTNRYIIQLLGITAGEQRQLRTIIGKDERQDRLTERRRRAGMVARGEWLSPAQERRSRAVLMRSQGMTQAAIAGELGITQGRVSQILKGSGY